MKYGLDLSALVAEYAEDPANTISSLLFRINEGLTLARNETKDLRRKDDLRNLLATIIRLRLQWDETERKMHRARQ